MAALGRILQVIGWIWLLAGFFGNFINLPVGSIVPGIIVLFVSRIIRAQAARQERAEDLEAASLPPNIEPVVVEPKPPVPSERARPQPATRVEPTPEPTRHPTVETETKRDVALEKILLSGAELEDRLRKRETAVPDEIEDGHVPLSSAEMIARARQRWDRRP